MKISFLSLLFGIIFLIEGPSFACKDGIDCGEQACSGKLTQRSIEFDGAIKKEEQRVLDLVAASIEDQKRRIANPSVYKPAGSFLSQLDKSETYVHAYQELGKSLERLAHSHAHSDFFAEYAEQLLKMIELFST